MKGLVPHRCCSKSILEVGLASRGITYVPLFTTIVGNDPGWHPNSFSPASRTDILIRVLQTRTWLWPEPDDYRQTNKPPADMTSLLKVPIQLPLVPASARVHPGAPLNKTLRRNMILIREKIQMSPLWSVNSSSFRDLRRVLDGGAWSRWRLGLPAPVPYQRLSNVTSPDQHVKRRSES